MLELAVLLTKIHDLTARRFPLRVSAQTALAGLEEFLGPAEPDNKFETVGS